MCFVMVTLHFPPAVWEHWVHRALSFSIFSFFLFFFFVLHGGLVSSPSPILVYSFGAGYPHTTLLLSVSWSFGMVRSRLCLELSSCVRSSVIPKGLVCLSVVSVPTFPPQSPLSLTCALFCLLSSNPLICSLPILPCSSSSSSSTSTSFSLLFLRLGFSFSDWLALSAGAGHAGGVGFAAQRVQRAVPQRPRTALLRPVPALRAPLQGAAVAGLPARHAPPTQLRPAG